MQPSILMLASGRARTRLGAAVLAAGLLAIAPDASAFCRTTTCKCKTDAPLPDGPNGLPQSTCGQPTGDCPKDEHGCPTKGTPVSWAGGCVGYSPNLIGTAQLSDEEWSAAFRESFHAWQLADCGGGAHPSIELFALRATTCGESKYNKGGPNVNSVYFTDTGWTGPQTPENLDHVLARARINFEPSGEIVDGDIAINSARKEFTVTDVKENVEQDLVSVLTHEVGHFLGLAHSDVKQSVMYWSYGRGVIRRKLHQDDIDAICTAYPPARKTTCDPTPRGGLQDTCGPQPEITSGCAAASNVETASSGVAYALGVLGFVAVRGMAKRMRRSR